MIRRRLWDGIGLAVALAACSGGGSNDNALTGAWRLRTLDGIAPATGKALAWDFADKTVRATLTPGCVLECEYSTTAGVLAVGRLVSQDGTACDATGGQSETLLLKAFLPAATGPLLSYAVSGEALTVTVDNPAASETRSRVVLARVSLDAGYLADAGTSTADGGGVGDSGVVGGDAGAPLDSGLSAGDGGADAGASQDGGAAGDAGASGADAGAVCYELPYVGITSPSAYETVDEKVYLLGGRTASPLGDIDIIRVLDLRSGTWSELPFLLPYPIQDAATAIYFNGHFYITPGLTTGEYNGWGSHSKLIDVDLIHGAAAETVAIPYGGAIWDLLSCGANGKMYIFGGGNGADQTGIFEYTPGSNSMSRVASMAYLHRVGAATFAADGWIYIMGHSAQVERFNPATRSVETMRAALPPELLGIVGLSAVWHIPSESAIYFAVGVNGGSVLNPPIYSFNYAADVMTKTRLFVSGNVTGGAGGNVGIRDGANPYAAFVFKQGADASKPQQLCREALAIPGAPP